ncbi:UNVERIFIED_CONTAM: hypothetical protein BEN50_22355 [Euhalothece sp. KZN 001]
MTTVCLLGEPDLQLRSELLSRETAADALAMYTLMAPFENSVAVRTVSLGTAVALCNDLDWYISRFVDRAMILEESISTEEWLSRPLATAVRDQTIDPDATRRYLAIYGLTAGRLTDPLFTRIVDDQPLPPYDLEPVEATLVVRVTADEFRAG